MTPKSYTPPLAGFFRKVAFACILALVSFASTPAFAAFGLTTTTSYYQVDTDAGLVFKVSRTTGDIKSLVFNGVEYQEPTKGTQINSGLGTSNVTATTVGTDYIKITVVDTTGTLTHYYMARKGYSHVYMATYFTAEPSIGLVRFIVRIPHALLPNGPTPSDIYSTVSTVEASDVFALSNGETRSKHYSNHRLKDWIYTGATGSSVGVWMVRGSDEGGSGGPFYRCLINQGGADQEIYEIVNYGEGQIEAFRFGILNPYTLVFTTGSTPPTLDTSWFADMGLTGYLTGPAWRGRVSAEAITGRDPNYEYTVGFANSTAQYWITADTDTGAFNCTGMLSGTYTMTIYKNELGVYTAQVPIIGGSFQFGTIAITADPSATPVLWRIGDWDGTPNEFLNADKATTMHPSDPRIATWNPGPYVIGVSSPATGFPCYQWKGVNGSQVVQFNLTAAQCTAHTVRIGINTAYANARPKITINGWTSANPSPSTQPTSRTLTVGTYRGNNTTYTFNVPASAFVEGTNTLTIMPISGSGSTAYLSAGYSVDCVDLY